MRALEAPQMVAAFHGGGTLEIGSARAGQGGEPTSASASSSDPNVTLHPPASPYTVMTGSVIPAVMVSGINSDLPGPILAQVSESVFDSASGKSSAHSPGQPVGGRISQCFELRPAASSDRISTADLPGYVEHGSATDAGQRPGRVRRVYRPGEQPLSRDVRYGGADEFDQRGADGRTDGGFRRRRDVRPLWLHQPNQWAMAGETAGSAGSAQLGGLGQQMLGKGLNRPPTIEIRPGYEFNVMVTEDLVFPAPYKG